MLASDRVTTKKVYKGSHHKYRNISRRQRKKTRQIEFSRYGNRERKTKEAVDLPLVPKKNLNR